MFNFPLFFFLATLLFLISASYFDLKSRQVPNFLILYFSLIALSFKILQSFYLNNFNFILNSLFSFILCFFVFFLIWSFGVIAAGDLKVFLVISLFNPFSISFIYNSSLGIPVFFIYIFIFSLVCLLPYTLIIGIIKTFKYKRNIKKIFILKDLLSIFKFSLFLYILFFILDFFFKVNNIILLISTFILMIVFNKLQKLFSKQISFLLYVVFSLVFIITLFLKQFLLLRYLVNIFVFILLFRLIINIIKVISSNLITIKPINKLKEGDIPYYNYYYVNNKLIVKKVKFREKLSLFLKNKYYKNLKIDSSKAGGLESADIRFLKRMYKNNLIGKEIVLKDSQAFVPAVLLAYILLAIIGEKIV
jgi:Flp pilus assembly protein protease CpaA